MKTTKKAFDCVEMMHEGALRIYEETKDHDRGGGIGLWQRKDEEARKNHPQLRELPDS